MLGIRAGNAPDLLLGEAAATASRLSLGLGVALIVTLSGFPSLWANAIYAARRWVDGLAGLLLLSAGLILLCEVTGVRVAGRRGGLAARSVPWLSEVLGLAMGLAIYHDLDPTFDAMFFGAGMIVPTSHSPWTVAFFSAGLAGIYVPLALAVVSAALAGGGMEKRSWVPVTMTVVLGLVVAIIGGLLLIAAGITSWAQSAPVQPAPVKPEPEHGAHGTPEAWKFSWPAGDPVVGREVFVKLECFTCHEVKGEQFPAPDPGRVGPELSAMAPLHPAEYFAEAIINPNAVVEEGKDYRAADGKSKMPSYNDLVTVQEVIDLVAYLTGLKGDGATPASGGHGGAGANMMPGGQMPRH